MFWREFLLCEEDDIRDQPFNWGITASEVHLTKKLNPAAMECLFLLQPEIDLGLLSSKTLVLTRTSLGPAFFVDD